MTHETFWTVDSPHIAISANPDAALRKGDLVAVYSDPWHFRVMAVLRRSRKGGRVRVDDLPTHGMGRADDQRRYVPLASVRLIMDDGDWPTEQRPGMRILTRSARRRNGQVRA